MSRLVIIAGLYVCLAGSLGLAQGPSPETAAPLFPSGGLLSVGFTTSSNRVLSETVEVPRPATAREIPFTFAWGMRRDFQFTATVPIVSTRFRDQSGTGIGDTTLLLKYRFYRADSERGTTQAAVSVGPKLPTGRTSLKDHSGMLLPVHLQAGTGSTDLMANVSWTYTGLFDVKKLVADISGDVVVRTEGTQQTRQGDLEDIRFWLSYRPLQQKSVGKEWWIGPSVRWHREGRDVRQGQAVNETGGRMFVLGATTYFSPGPGTILWLGMEWPVMHSMNGAPFAPRQRIALGITRQFVIHR
jgi:hypothetical protein